MLHRIENKCIKLEEENHYLQSLIEKKHPSKPNHKMLDNESPNSSVVYAVNILSKEVTKVTNTFALQDRIFKSCIENLETEAETSQKIHEKVGEYIETCKANDLHMQKIIHHNEKFKESFSEIMRTENSSPGFGHVAPSLYDEIKDFEINNQKNDNFVLVSEAKLCRLNGLKKLLKNLREEVHKITRFEGKKLRIKDKIIRKGMLGFTTVLNF